MNALGYDCTKKKWITKEQLKKILQQKRKIKEAKEKANEIKRIKNLGLFLCIFVVVAYKFSRIRNSRKINVKSSK